MRNYCQCSEGHIFKNGGKQNGFYFFHFEQHPIYKMRNWANKLCIFIFAVIIFVLISIYLIPAAQLIIVLVYMVISYSALFSKSRSSIPILNTFSEFNFVNYNIKPENIKKIRYQKHWLYPGYSVIIPEFTVSIAFQKKHEENKPLIFEEHTIESHVIPCVKYIDAIKMAVNNIHEEESMAKSCNNTLVKNEQ